MANKQGTYVILAIVLMLGIIAVTIFSNKSQAPAEPEVEPVAESQTVRLYYYNEPADRQLSENNEPQCSEEAILPITRSITTSETPIEDTINLLLAGEITETESNNGFSTEFPNPQFSLVNSSLNDGVLTLEFTEVPGFTSGGSCRVTLLAGQITKTASQFPEVREVKILPEEIFQP